MRPEAEAAVIPAVARDLDRGFGPGPGALAATDAHATIADVHATVLRALGIDPSTELVTPAARPIRLSEGTPIDALV